MESHHPKLLQKNLPRKDLDLIFGQPGVSLAADQESALIGVFLFPRSQDLQMVGADRGYGMCCIMIRYSTTTPHYDSMQRFCMRASKKRRGIHAFKMILPSMILSSFQPGRSEADRSVCAPFVAALGRVRTGAKGAWAPLSCAR